MDTQSDSTGNVWDPRFFLVSLVALSLAALPALFSQAATMHWEEAHNASQAAAWSWMPTEDWLKLQHRGFCTGCPVVALQGAALFTLTGSTSIVVWKLIPFSYMLLWGLSSVFAARGLAGARAGWWTLALCCVPPVLLSAVFWRAWANHMEAGAWTMASFALLVCLPKRGLWWSGAAAAMALGMSLSALPPLLGVGVHLLMHRGWRGSLPWLGGASALLLPGLWWFSQQPSPPSTALLHMASELAPMSYGDELRAVLSPTRWSAILGGPVAPLRALLMLTALVELARSRHRLLLLSPVAALLAVFLTPFSVLDLSSELVIGNRYLVPALLWVPLLQGLGWASLEDHTPRWGAGLLALTVLVGLPSRHLELGPWITGHLTHGRSAAWELPRRQIFGRQFRGVSEVRCPPTDGLCTQVDAYAQGATSEEMPISPLHAAGRGGRVGAVGERAGRTCWDILREAEALSSAWGDELQAAFLGEAASTACFEEALDGPASPLVARAHGWGRCWPDPPAALHSWVSVPRDLSPDGARGCLLALGQHAGSQLGPGAADVVRPWLPEAHEPFLRGVADAVEHPGRRVLLP